MYKGERFNSITHLLGSIASGIGLFILLYLAIQQGDSWKMISFGIYGFTLLSLYTFSTLYHSFRGRLKKIFQKLDHIAIYLLIAGTYTPFTLVTLQGQTGWIVFTTVWCLAILGIIVELKHKKGLRILPIMIYLIMGWLIVLVIEPLIQSITLTGFTWLFAGGLFYMAGLIFYALDHKYKLAHGIWHLFVLAGSFSHFFTIANYVA